MASSWIDRSKLIQIDSFGSLPVLLQAQFRKLEELVARCLCAASKLGNVVIITNAEAGWIEYSSKRFMPRLLPVLEGMRVVSARTSYERFYPGAPLCWKAAAFAHESNQIFCDSDSCREIISFGDSNEERTAVKIAAGQLRAVPKSIKFVDLPSLDQLCQQVETVMSWLLWVTDHGTELDLMLKATVGEEPSSSVQLSTSSLHIPFRPPPLSSITPRA